MFAFYACGFRVSDIITLEWKHINWEKKVISKNFFKTKSNSIDIPLIDQAIAILEKWKGRNDRFVFDILPEDFNLNDSKQLRYYLTAKNRVFQESLKTLGKKIGVGFNLTFHSARHSFAVYEIKQGVNIYMLSKLLGHASVAVTEKVYAEFLPDEIENVVKSTMVFDFAKKNNTDKDESKKEEE